MCGENYISRLNQIWNRHGVILRFGTVLISSFLKGKGNKYYWNIFRKKFINLQHAAYPDICLAWLRHEKHLNKKYWWILKKQWERGERSAMGVKSSRRDSFGDFPKEVSPVVKNLPCRDFHVPMQGTWVWSLVGELKFPRAGEQLSPRTPQRICALQRKILSAAATTWHSQVYNTFIS